MGQAASCRGGGLSASGVAEKIMYHVPEMLWISGAQMSVDHGWPASLPLLSGLKATRVSALSQLSVRDLERRRVMLLLVL